MDYPYTKPRMPVQGAYQSPGPAGYVLPQLSGQTLHDPRSVHSKAPAYTFGVRHCKLTADCSPGPCYLPQQGMYKDGKDGTPHYSLYSRTRELSRLNVPGPGAYSPEKAGPSGRYHHPSYPFGRRTLPCKKDNTPAPNAYTKDAMIGETVQSGKKRAPIYSFRPKFEIGSFTEDHAKTPGPGAYMTIDPNTVRNKKPAYSMTGRNLMPGDGTIKPGPGAHSPEKVYINKRAAPKHSFGIKHSDYLAPLIVEPVN